MVMTSLLASPCQHQPCAWRLCRWGCGRRRSRSATYPWAFCFVGLTRRAIAQALVLALLVIKAKPGANARFRLGDAGIGVEVDLLVFQAAPRLTKSMITAR